MAHLSDFDWDIFISYAHDDRPRLGPEAGWIPRFKELLQIKLNMLTGRHYSVYFDEHAQRFGEPIEDILDKARRSALFLMIGSPNFVASEWCLSELQAFREQVRSETRIFNAELIGLRGESRYPEAVPNNLSARFWYEEPGRRTRLTLPPSSPKFSRLLSALAQQICDRLDDVGAVAGSAVIEPGSSEPPRERAVFLAYTADDVSEDRIRVRDYLQSLGIAVLPDPFLPPGDSARYRKSVATGLARADVFVQLLGETPSQPVAGVEEGYTFHQYHAAMAREPQGLQILQWRSRRVRLADIGDEAYRALLDGATVELGGLTQFNQRVAAAARPPAPDPQSDGLEVFINADDLDCRYAFDLVDACARKSRWGEMAESGKDNDYLRRRYGDAKLVTFLYANGKLSWVRAQVDIFRRAWAERGGGAVKPLLIYLGPTEEPQAPASAGDRSRLPFSAPGLKLCGEPDAWTVLPFELELDKLPS